MRGQAVLNIGIFAVAVALGYMVGGSGTPVVGAIAPTIFGLVAAALSLVASGRMPNIGPVAANTGEERDPEAAARVGVVLTVFAVAFVGGSVVGTMARTQEWFAPELADPPSFPWEGDASNPPTIRTAIYWLRLQQVLIEHGYTTDAVSELYAIQAAEWKRIANSPDGQDLSTEGSLSEGDWDILEPITLPGEFQGVGEHNPFAVIYGESELEEGKGETDPELLKEWQLLEESKGASPSKNPSLGD